MEVIAQEKGYKVIDGCMIDANMVKVPTQRLNQEEREKLSRVAS